MKIKYDILFRDDDEVFKVDGGSFFQSVELACPAQVGDIIEGVKRSDRYEVKVLEIVHCPHRSDAVELLCDILLMEKI